MVFNLPNTLTSFRILAVPLVVVIFYLPFDWARPASGLLFGLAGLLIFCFGLLADQLAAILRDLRF